MRSIGSKMFMTFSVALVAFGAVAVVAVGRMHSLGTDLRLLSEGYLPLTRIAAQIDVKDWATARAPEVKVMDPAARKVFLPIARSHFPAVVKEKLAEARTVLGRAQAIASGPDARFFADISARVDVLDARWTAYDAAARELFDAVERSRAGPDDPVVAERAEVARKLEKSLSLDVKLLQAALDGQVASRLHAAERAERRSAILVVIYALLAGAIGLGATVIAQRLLAPIRILTDGVKAVAAGDLSRKVDVRSGDELGLLAREFNAMAASLDRQRSDLLRAERLAAVGRISAQITHEIRNPLNAIGLNAELLAEEVERLEGRRAGPAPVPAGGSPAPATADPRDEVAPPSEIRTLALAIGREVDRLGAVTEDYLRFARLPRPVFEREDVNEILAGVADFLRVELAAARVELRLDLAGGLPAVRADEGQLRAAFMNLLRNSREAMPAGGVVTLTTRRGPEGIEVLVRDTGGGIPAQALPRIFDPFYSTKERGTGLGLAFAQQVVQEHGGTIVCESVVGGGTVFTVKLPSAADEQAPADVDVGEALGA